MIRTFTALSSVVRVELADDVGPEPRALAELLLAGYPAVVDAEPELRYLLRAGAMSRIAEPRSHDEAVTDPQDLVPLFELDLYQQLAKRAAPGWLLHAAALERDGRAFVFAGPSGAGKTTLTLALLARGWRLVTEEMVLVDRSRIVRGLARPIHAPGRGPQRDALPRDWAQLDYPLRRGAEVHRHVIAQPPAAVRVTEPLPLAAIARLDHAPDRPAALTALPAHRALPRMWDATLRQDDDGLAAAAALVAQVPVYDLESSSVDQAISLAEQLVP